MPSSWTDTTDRQLLLTIIHLSAPTLPKWEQVAAMMGEGYSKEAVRQHYQKLRKDTEAQLGAPEAAAGMKATATGTPRKRKPKGETPSKSTGKRKGRKGEEKVESDDEERASPKKKVNIEAEAEAEEEGEEAF